MKYIVFVWLLLFTMSASGQSSLVDLFKDPKEKGDEYFEAFAYAKARDAYLESLKDGAGNRNHLAIKIAECYRKLNDAENAVSWYEKADLDQANKPALYFHYAEALSSVQRYAEAKKMYEKYAVATGDSRSLAKMTVIDNQKQLYRNAAAVEVTPVAFNAETADFSPTSYGEGVVFVSARSNGRSAAMLFNWDGSEFLNLYQVQGTDVMPFSSEINSKFHEGPAVFYDNDQRVIFTRNNFQNGKIMTSQEGIVKLKLFSAERSGEGRWTAVEPLSLNSDQYSVGHPAITPDGSHLYFASDMPGGHGGVDLYMSERKDGIWQQPLNMGPEINTPGDELFPYLSGNDLYFASNGHGGLGGLDIFGVTLGKSSSLKVVNLGSPINSSKDDFGLMIDSTGLGGYFSSNRQKGDDIFAFKSSVSLLNDYKLTGTVRDAQTKAVVANGTVKLMKGDEAVAEIFTDSLGRFTTSIEPGQEYWLKVSAEDYLPENKQLLTLADQQEWHQDINLLRDHGFGLQAVITDKQAGKPLSEAEITILDNLTNEQVLKKKTGETGELLYSIADKELNDRVSYQIKVEKEGYLGKTVTYNATLDQPGNINVSSVLDLALDKIDIGTDIGKLIDIKPIYFDVGKATIRSDAALELDKIVKIMTENPNLEIELGSHTDARGSAKSNMSLSARRAEASAAYIISQGIDSARIKGKGYGESLLINGCSDGVRCSDQEHQLNRRTEFKITKY